MKKIIIAFIILISAFVTTANAASTATATLSSFIQRGLIANDAGSTGSITSVIYSLGAAADGIATWDSGTGGGVASDFLSNPRWFQTVTWSGLNVAAGDTFNFSGLDIDLITSFSPLSVSGGILDTTGSSLVNATLSLIWSDGSVGSVNLIQQAWATTQNLRIGSSVNAVPLPAAVWLFGPALLGFMSMRRKTKSVA
jgi:hypothetical protein